MKSTSRSRYKAWSVTIVEKRNGFEVKVYSVIGEFIHGIVNERLMGRWTGHAKTIMAWTLKLSTCPVTKNNY